MNKRKVLSILLLALITVTLAVSCSSNIDTPAANTEELAYVTFGNGHSRELSTSYETLPYNSLYWFYTAEKDDQYGTTGQVGLTEGRPTAAVSTDENEGPVKGLSGQVGPFSQGKWIFTLYAYREYVNEDGSGTGRPNMSNLIYKSAGVPVTLKGSDVKNVPVSVSLQGDYGTLDFSGANFAWYKESDNQTVGTGDVYLRINIKGTADKDSAPIDVIKIEKVITPNYKLPTYIDFGYGGSGKFPAGYYTCTVQAYVAEDLSNIEDLNAAIIKGDSTYKASQAFGLRVYGNATTKISGDLTEGLFAEVSFDVAKQDMKVFVPNANGSASITNISITPSGEANKNTTVEFETGALNSVSNKTLQLDVKVTTVESADNKFNITGTDANNKSAVAGIDVILWATDSTGSSNKVSNFENKYATVTTYIAKGLSNVVVKYNGTDGKSDPIASSTDSNVADELSSDTDTALGYNSDTGLLRFKTKHFSEYYVVADKVVALNVNTNTAYATLKDAIDAVPSNAENTTDIVLLSNVTDAPGMSVEGGKNFVVDFNGYTYTLNKPGAGSTNTETNGFQLLKGSTITFKNGTINISEDNKTLATNGRNIKRIIQNYSELTLENMTIDGTNQFGGANLVMSFNNDPVTIIGNTNIIAEEGKVAFDADGNWGGYNRSEVKINTTGRIIGDIKVAEGYLTFENGNVIGGIVRTNETDEAQKNRISVKGGTFSTDPSDYVAFGYDVVETADGYVVSTSTELTVNDADQLMKFAASVNAGNDYAGKTITLKSDINLTGKKWLPIGYSSRSNTEGPIFRGTFDGQNHTITNIKHKETKDKMPSGFFGTVEGAKISNLVIGGTKLENGSYVYDGQSSFTGEKDSAAGVVAFVIGSGNTVIENCKNYATISGSAPAGIVSRLYNQNSGSNNISNNIINNCYNYGFIDGKNLAESGKAGGIVAITQSNSNSTISNCHNKGTIETNDFNAGGIIGYVNPGCIIERCTNSKTVSNSNTKDSRSVGGIVGWVANTSDVLPVSLNNCSNSGTINSDGCAGGIAGRICNQTTVNNCTNSGSVSNYNERTTGYAGGIIGNNDGGTINECNNTAAVSGVQYSGGVVGYWGFTSNISGSISNCSGGTADITIINNSNNSNNWAGRIVGCANCVYTSEPFGSISINDSNGDSYEKGLKTIGLSTFGTLKDVLTVKSGTLHGLPGLRDNSNQSEHTIIFKEGSQLNLDNKTYSFNTSVTFSTKEVNGKWTWDTSTLKSNKSGSASISKENYHMTYGEFTVNEVEFLFQVTNGNSFADDVDKMTITVEELDQAENDAWTIVFGKCTKYYRISITGLAALNDFGPDLYIKGATNCNCPEGSGDVLKAGYYSSSSIDGYFKLVSLHY